MATLTDDELAFFQASNSLEIDDNGRRVLKGLTYEETEEYLAYWRTHLHEKDNPATHRRQRFLQQHWKHLQAVRNTSTA